MLNTVPSKIIPAIMIGGSGTRLWPLSRANMPKQFLRLTNEKSLFQNTLARVQGPMFDDPWLLTGEAFLDLAVGQMREHRSNCRGIVIEPLQRGTAAAIAAITVAISRIDPEALILAVPADHVIKHDEAFRMAIAQAAPIAEDGKIVTFGIVPTAPETGFGYIRPGTPIQTGDRVIGAHVEQPGGFLEKPNAVRAAEFVAAGYYWNAGIFLFKASAMLRELEQHAPETLAAITRSFGHELQQDAEPLLIKPDAAEFAAAPADQPIDTAVMEKSASVAVVPCDNIGWADIGSLSALWEIHDKDQHGNVIKGMSLVSNATDCFVYSTTERRVVVSHASNLMVIDTEDAVVVLPRDEAQQVKNIVNALKKIDAPELSFTRSATMDWGTIQTVSVTESSRICTVLLSQGAGFSRRVAASGSETWLLNRGDAVHTVRDASAAFVAGVPVILARGDSLRIETANQPAEFTLIVHAPEEGTSIGDGFVTSATVVADAALVA
jgi:mannose-1-phosphate guanylyltransferase/mannose-6-phosphate isomerase